MAGHKWTVVDYYLRRNFFLSSRYLSLLACYVVKSLLFIYYLWCNYTLPNQVEQIAFSVIFVTCSSNFYD